MIQLSQAAIAEVKRLRDRQPQKSPYLSVSVKPGGCSQYYYLLEFISELNAGDRLINVGEVTVAIKADSLPYLNGLAIDYSEDLMGGGFRFDNPNATQSCGCGNSFAVDSTLVGV
jgi:iron-sulfur cluster assembly protein